MDSDSQRLAAVEQEFKDLIHQRTTLKILERKQELTSDEQDELVVLEMPLAEARDNKMCYQQLIKLAIMEPETEAMTFKDADEDWIHFVTGVDTSFRRWPASSLMKLLTRILNSRLRLKKLATVSIS